MIVRCTFAAYFTDADRRALRAHYGRSGVATRDELKAELEHRGNIQNLFWTGILQLDEDEEDELEAKGDPNATRTQPGGRHG